MAAPDSPLRVESSEGILVVTFRDGILLDPVAVERIEKALTTLSNDERPQRLLLDFHGVHALSSQLLSVLLKANDAVACHDGRVALCNLEEKVEEIFDITKLTEVFKIHDNRAEAIRQLKGT
jgi:anti-anti-sigma factor